MDLDALYQELILDHFRRPRCQGCLATSTKNMIMHNPLCGDRIELSINSDGQNLREIAFAGQGCSISQASASMMSDLVKGKPIAEVKELIAIFKEMMRGELAEAELDRLGDSAALLGVRKFAARIKCALLAWEALERSLDETGKS